MISLVTMIKDFWGFRIQLNLERQKIIIICEPLRKVS